MCHVAGALDLHNVSSLDFLLTILSVLLNYAGPFFLKHVTRSSSSCCASDASSYRQILDAIDDEHPTQESRTKAYIYAFLAFTCSVLKACALDSSVWLALTSKAGSGGSSSSLAWPTSVHKDSISAHGGTLRQGSQAKRLLWNHQQRQERRK